MIEVTRPTSSGLIAATVLAALALVAAALLVLAPPGARGQDRSILGPELRQTLSRAPSNERIPVLVEVRRAEAPPPLALLPELRAAEQATNLAGLYDASIDALARRLPAELSLDLRMGRLLWIGGAVSAELTPEQIRALEDQSGVQRIYYDGLVEATLGAESGEFMPRLWAAGLPTGQAAGTPPWGLSAIGAPALWQAGATGEGTVVAIIDSGVDGDHPLLSRKWRGLSTSAREAWFDPWGLSSTPVDDDGTAGIGHGTIVMTVAVGSLEPGDTLIEGGISRVVQDPLEVVTGVAPGAEWVAADAFQGFGGVTYTRRSLLLQAMQWVLDPDSDPATVSDVPDVLNNSWGFRPGGCDGVFNRAIDALELVGIPVVFASGNRGAGFDTVAAPAERADLLLNAFAVGAAEQRNGDVVVADNSLGGPSPCAPGAIKPEVVAPGSIPLVSRRADRSAELRGVSVAFTSWAAPHAAGALAVLRGLNGDASANTLKDALFSTAVDLPPLGPDNRSGAGLIDLGAAAVRVGGLGGVRLAVAGWRWDTAGATLAVELFNTGGAAFPGGTASLRRRADGQDLSTAPAPPIAARSRGRIAFSELPAELDNGRLSLRLSGEYGILEIAMTLTGTVASSVVLGDGAVQLGVDGRGRLGRVTGGPGFNLLGSDWLTAGAFMFAGETAVSDAAYVDVLRQALLKSNPVGSDTDWRDLNVSADGAAAQIAFSDDWALRPLGVTVRQVIELEASGDSAAFVLLSAAPEFGGRARVPLAGLLLDWDFGGRDSVTWDVGLGASLMTRADSSGPWVALATYPQGPATHAAVPLGTPVSGVYSDDGFGVLGAPDGFSDERKSALLRLGGQQTSNGSASDWAQLVTIGPLSRGQEVLFLIAVGRTEGALATALAAARARAAGSSGSQQVAAAAGLQLLPAYPNPFDPTATDAITLPFLVNRGEDAVAARLEVFTISGRLVYSERRELLPSEPVQPFRWNGLQADGEPLASGIYGYVIQVGRRKRAGKFLLLK